jgi:hypothetical protein
MRVRVPGWPQSYTERECKNACKIVHAEKSRVGPKASQIFARQSYALTANRRLRSGRAGQGRDRRAHTDPCAGCSKRSPYRAQRNRGSLFPPVIPGRRQRVRAKRGPMTGSAASPESIRRSCNHRFRVRGLAPAPRNDGGVNRTSSIVPARHVSSEVSRLTQSEGRSADRRSGAAEKPPQRSGIKDYSLRKAPVNRRGRLIHRAG